MNTTEKGNEFENLVFSVLEMINPKNIEFYRGGSDRGRDIVASFEYNGLTRTIIVECKNYNSSINQKDICNSLNWAVTTKPDLFYIWTNNYITPATKDYILSIAKQYKLNVAWEEKDTSQKYIEAFKNQDIDILDSLRQKILNKLNIKNFSQQLEYTSCILPSNHFLINRKTEKEQLLQKDKNCFFLVGPSCVGKTQLAKNIAKEHFQKGSFVFWHRVLVQDNECQLKSLLEALSIFFSCVLKRNELNEYLINHGCFLTSSLINIIKSILNNFNCVLFIDDVHKCNQNNHQYKEFLIQLLEINTSKLYLLGWFNIFDINDIKLNNIIMFVDVTPLSAHHIREIALNENENLNELELNEIVERSDGLPGLAEIISINKNSADFGGLISYFRSIISIMDEKEKTLLFSLAISRISLPTKLLETLGYRIACEKLTQKRLAKFEGNKIILHDMYKKNILDLLYLMPEETFTILEKCAEDNNPLIYIDILSLFCKTNHHERYDGLLKDKFDSLLNMGYDVMLLNSLQEREKLNKKNALTILVKKMILLERKAEYNILANYINITKDIIDESHEDYYRWNYIYLRLRYFQCDFLNMLNDFYNDFNKYQTYPIDIYLQILFIIGRTYYVVGEINIATEIYYFIFNLAMRNNLDNLATKAIHRICIIEEKLSLFDDANQTLNNLIESRYFISSKRQAFACYRLSKCALGKNHLNKALEYNQKSLDIKKSLNAQRGLVFSMKLNSQIYYRKNDIPSALYWGEEAFKKAKTLGLNKEEVSTGIVYAQVLLSENYEKEAINILSVCIEQACNMCLAHRLKSIINLCNEYGLANLKDKAVNSLSYAESNIEKMTFLYKQHFKEKIENDCDLSKVYDLVYRKKALSPLLMML